jgi:TRAP-type C4-dicarboxylate transport system permease small subunit
MIKFESLFDKLSDYLMWLSCAIGFLMMMHVTLDVAGRVLFNLPLPSTIEIVSGYYMVAITFLPLAYVSRGEGQIVVELFTRGLSARSLLRFSVVVNAITIAYLSLVTWKTAEMAIEQTLEGENWESASGFISIWPSRWALPIGFGTMAVFILYRTYFKIFRANEIQQEMGE